MSNVQCTGLCAAGLGSRLCHRRFWCRKDFVAAAIYRIKHVAIKTTNVYPVAHYNTTMHVSATHYNTTPHVYPATHCNTPTYVYPATHYNTTTCVYTTIRQYMLLCPHKDENSVYGTAQPYIVWHNSVYGTAHGTISAGKVMDARMWQACGLARVEITAKHWNEPRNTAQPYTQHAMAMNVLMQA